MGWRQYLSCSFFDTISTTFARRVGNGELVFSLKVSNFYRQLSGGKTNDYASNHTHLHSDLVSGTGLVQMLGYDLFGLDFL